MYQKTALLQGKRLQVCDYYMLWGMLAPFGADYFITGSLDYTGVEGCKFFFLLCSLLCMSQVREVWVKLWLAMSEVIGNLLL